MKIEYNHTIQQLRFLDKEELIQLILDLEEEYQQIRQQWAIVHGIHEF